MTTGDDPVHPDRTLHDRRAFERLRRGDPRAREELIVRMLPLARLLAARYRGSDEDMDDLIQVATEALIKAIDRFDPDRGVAFSTFAVPTILGELRRHFRDRSWAVRPPREVQERWLRVERCSDALHRELRRAPSVQELAARLGCDEEEVLEALQAGSAYRSLSMDAPLTGDAEGDALADVVGTQEHGFRRAEDRLTVDALMDTLSERERAVLRMRFEQDMLQSEIGEVIGVSQMQVSRIIRQAIGRLRLEAARRDR